MPDAQSRAFVAINLGGVLCANARESFQAAARRWRASYVELTESSVPAGISAPVVTFSLFEIVPAERIFCLDAADAIVRGDAPSPFEICPPEKFGAVKNTFPRLPAWRILLEQEDADWEVLNEACGGKLEKQFFINSGMMVLSRSYHQRMMDRAFGLQGPNVARLIWRTQSAINYAAAELGVPLLLMDETWNYVCPHDVGHWDWMEHYVYHFAGSPDRRTILPGLRWQMPLSNHWSEKLRHRPRLRRLVAWSETRLRPPSPRRVAASAARLGRQVKRVPLLGPVAQYLYWWAALPWKMSRALDNTHAILERHQSLHLRIRRLERWTEDLKQAQDRRAAPAEPKEPAREGPAASNRTGAADS
jgi:hypothetical protein